MHTVLCLYEVLHASLLEAIGLEVQTIGPLSLEQSFAGESLICEAPAQQNSVEEL